MRTRWKVSEDWITVGILWLGFGWVPMALLGNIVTGGDSNHLKWGFPAGVAIVWGPPILYGTYLLARWLCTIGAPITRVTEPVITDLREAHHDR